MDDGRELHQVEQFGADGAERRFTVACMANEAIGNIRQQLEGDDFLWLDLRAATDDEIATAGAELGLHPLTIEDLQEFQQRAKVEEYDDYLYLVSYGVAPVHDEDRIVEVHIVYSPNFLVTVSKDDSLELRQLHESAGERRYSGQELLHAVLDTLVDSYAPLLDELDSKLESIETKILDRDLKGREVDIHEIRHTLGRISRTVHRQSEALTRLPEMLRRMPDHNVANTPYFRDVQDHLIRVSQSADGLRDRVSGSFELYLAALDNRQNAIMKQFTIIAGIFLPLSVVTGFFGMNFGWMVQHINSGWHFLALGIVMPLLIFAVLVAWIRSRGLLDD